jgi:hypothetical protein
MGIWEPVKIDNGKVYHCQLGPLGLWIKRHEDELHIAAKQDSDGQEVIALASINQAEPAGLDWGRWIAGQRDIVQLYPVMPNRPLMVRPETYVNIPKDHEALFFVSIPVWVRICAGKDESLCLCEKPTVILSNIWHGDNLAGELCYSLKTRARRKIDETGQPQPWRVICPVKIKNASTSQLEVQRICIDPSFLNVYQGSNQPWTDTVELTFKGDSSDVNYAANQYQGIGQLLSKARRPFKNDFLHKGLMNFKAFSGIFL